MKTLTINIDIKNHKESFWSKSLSSYGKLFVKDGKILQKQILPCANLTLKIFSIVTTIFPGWFGIEGCKSENVVKLRFLGNSYS